MKRINLFWIIWIFCTLEFKDIACVSYPGVYRNELPVIIPGASPIENVFVTERYGINYECIETCYPILNVCDDKCSIMPDLPECSQCQPAVQPTPIIIETPPYEPIPPTFEQSVQPIVPYPQRTPRPQIPKPIAPSRPIFRSPPRPILPEIPRPPQFEYFEPVLPTPILPDIPQPPELEIFDFSSELPPEPIIPSVPKPPVLELIEPELPHPPDVEEFEPEISTQPNEPELQPFQPEAPPKPILPEIPRPPQLEIELPPLPILPEVPQVEVELPPQPIHYEIPRPPVPQQISPELTPEFEPILPPQLILPEIPLPPEIEPMLPDMEIYSHVLEPPQPIYPYVPLPPQFEYFEPELAPYPMIEILEPIYPEIMNPGFVEIPQSPEEHIYIPTFFEPIYPEADNDYNSENAGLAVHKEILQQPILVDNDDFCDHCLLKRNISECEICLESGLPAEHFDLCSECLIKPSGPDCYPCYPILLNLCREFCIFEENDEDCSICYPQIELPAVVDEHLFNLVLQPEIEYVPVAPKEICPEYCALTPTSAECNQCAFGVEIIEKVCVDICSGYCLENPDDEQCAVCYTPIIPEIEEINYELPTLEVINYQCCYGDYCTPMPRNGVCPVVCKELCTTACSNECFNPTCPDCQEVIAQNEFRRTQFMIWLKSKLSDMKSRYMTMIEACIQRTELMYERELQAIEMEVDTSFLLA